MRHLTITAIALLVIALLASAPAEAEFYQWVDANGVTHFTDNPYNVPREYRPGGSKSSNPIDKSTDEAVDKAVNETPPVSGDPAPGYAKDDSVVDDPEVVRVYAWGYQRIGRINNECQQKMATAFPSEQMEKVVKKNLKKTYKEFSKEVAGKTVEEISKDTSKIETQMQKNVEQTLSDIVENVDITAFQKAGYDCYCGYVDDMADTNGKLIETFTKLVERKPELKGETVKIKGYPTEFKLDIEKLRQEGSKSALREQFHCS